MKPCWWTVPNTAFSHVYSGSIVGYLTTLYHLKRAVVMSCNPPGGLRRSETQTGFEPIISRIRVGIELAPHVTFALINGDSFYSTFAPLTRCSIFFWPCITDLGNRTTLARSFTMKMLDGVIQLLPPTATTLRSDDKCSSRVAP